jgi:tRNA-binding EMAP/Myf-like protein
MKDMISFDDFMAIEKKLEIRMGTISAVEFLPKNKRMLKMLVGFENEVRVVITNIGDKIEDPINTLLNTQHPFIMNLTPTVISGIVSQAMIMVPTLNGIIELKTIPNGAKLL